jgi:FemAB-related protein (PEP-CTERM system-associated)
VPIAPAQSAASVVAYREEQRDRWDEYVRNHLESTFLHLTAWKRTLEREFGYESRYLVAEQDGRIVGVLPLFLVSNWIVGRALISTPFGIYGGILADDDTVYSALCQAACRMASDEQIQFLELRERERVHSSDLQVKNLYVTFDLELPRTAEEMLQRIPRDVRNKIRKGMKSDLTSVVGREHLDAFYEIYAHTVRRLGTPVFSRRYFQTLCDELGEAAEVLLILHGSRPVAAALCVHHRDTVTSYYAGSLPDSWPLAANNFLYWEILRRACERGIRCFDFGRSKLGTGAYLFKVQWRMRERPMPYQYYLVRRKSMPDFSPVNPRLKLATDVWKRIPLPLTKVVGPSLVRLFP